MEKFIWNLLAINAVSNFFLTFANKFLVERNIWNILCFIHSKYASLSFLAEAIVYTYRTFWKFFLLIFCREVFKLNISWIKIIPIPLENFRNHAKYTELVNHTQMVYLKKTIMIKQTSWEYNWIFLQWKVCETKYKPNWNDTTNSTANPKMFFFWNIYWTNKKTICRIATTVLRKFVIRAN